MKLRVQGAEWSSLRGWKVVDWRTLYYVVHGPEGRSLTQLPRGSDATNNRM
jgi:hypothetical protein